MISVRFGGLLMAVGIVGSPYASSPYWQACLAIGLVFVCFGLGDYFGDQAAWSEARVLEEFIPAGIARDEAVEAMDNSPRLRTDPRGGELNWPPALAGVEETLFYHDARSAARVEVVGGVVVRVKAYPKSYLRVV